MNMPLPQGATVVGVDPGNTGGIALLSKSRIVEVVPIPIFQVKNKSGKWVTEWDLPELWNIFSRFAGAYPTAAAIEWNNPRNGNSVQSAIGCGRQIVFECICVRLGIPTIRIPPQTWTKEFGFGAKKPGKEKLEIQKRYDALVQRWPDQPEIHQRLITPRGAFTGRDGMIDAVWISAYYLDSE